MDITLCKGDNCPKKDTCYRHTSMSATYQYYFTEIPYKNGDCEYYKHRDI